MPQTTLQAGDIKGLTPAVRAVNSPDTFVLSGTNYAFDSRGPKSPFGSVIENGLPLGVLNRRGTQFTKIRDKTWVLTNEAIFSISEATGVLTPELVFDPFQEVHRWTYGFLNGYLYFCHPGIGILFINTRDGVRGLLQTPGVPSNPIAIVVDNGRLVVMDEFAMTWSDPSDGTNFIPKLGGAGAQAISDKVSGTPLMISSYARGTLVWTTEGVMRSEFTGGRESYRHRSVNTEYFPVNSFGVVQLDDNTSVLLDRRGLFSSKGESPVPFAPLFNEFLLDELKKNDSLFRSNSRMEWDPFSRRIFVSRAFQLTGDLYDSAFVLYVPLQKWGSWDTQHYGYGRGYWVDSTGLIKRYAGIPFSSTAKVDSSGYLYDAKREYPQLIQVQRQTETLGTTLRLGGLPESQTVAFARPELYTFDGTAVAAIQKEELKAKIVIGHFRLNEGVFADQMSEMIDIIVGSVESKEVSTTDVDYNTLPAGVTDEDYNTATGAEDYGLNPLSFINFRLRSIGSIDGISVFDAKVPLLSRFAQAIRYYAGGSVGIWHSLELKTSVPGEFFHVQHLAFNAIPAGRLL